MPLSCPRDTATSRWKAVARQTPHRPSGEGEGEPQLVAVGVWLSMRLLQQGRHSETDASKKMDDLHLTSDQQRHFQVTRAEYCQTGATSSTAHVFLQCPIVSKH
jgi:hypothetical protein